MRNRKLDENGDYSFGQNVNNFYIDIPETVVQAVVTRLQLWESEWFLDLREGTPYLNGIIGKYTTETIDQLVRTRILETKGVSEITFYESIFDADLRKITLNVTISTIYGAGLLNGTF